VNRRTDFVATLALDLLAAAGALLISTRIWQTVVTARPRPLADDVLGLNGRTVDAAPTALALVALAGVVALIATRGWWRRLIGGVLVLAGAGLVWWSLAGRTAVSAARARALVTGRHSGVGVDDAVVPQVTVHSVWPVLSAACGVLVVLAGLLAVLRGHRWTAMSARYEPQRAQRTADAPAGDRPAELPSSTAMWSALERGDDPTSR